MTKSQANDIIVLWHNRFASKTRTKYVLVRNLVNEYINSFDKDGNVVQ